MKRYDEIHIIPYKKIFLSEGKKQAIQLLTKQWDADSAKGLVKELEALDPTSPKNKYLELFAKFFIEFGADNRKFMVDDLLQLFIRDGIRDKIESIEKRNLKIDLSKIRNYKDFKKVLNETAGKITKGSAKKGMVGLTEGKDYLTVLKNKEVEAYIPLHYKASKVIASDKVGYCEGEWCTAYQKTDSYWEDYVIKNGVILVYIIVVDPDIDKYDPMELKTAIAFHSPSTYEVFNTKDESIKTTPQFSKIQSYVSNNWDKIRSHFPEPKIVLLKKFLSGLLLNKTFEDFKEFIDYDFILLKIEGDDLYIQIDKTWFSKIDGDYSIAENYLFTEDKDFIDFGLADHMGEDDVIQYIFENADSKTMKMLEDIFPNLDDIEDFDTADEMEKVYGRNAIGELQTIFIRAIDHLSERDFYETLYASYRDIVKNEIGGEIIGYEEEGLIKLSIWEIADGLIEQIDLDEEYLYIVRDDITNGDDLSFDIDFNNWTPDWSNTEFNEIFQTGLELEEDEIKREII